MTADRDRRAPPSPSCARTTAAATPCRPRASIPFQWNWDSCLTALGQRHFDEDRAWTEIETLFAHQWPDGMVPHIVFHVDGRRLLPRPRRLGDRPPDADLRHHPAAGRRLRGAAGSGTAPRPGRPPTRGRGRCCRSSPPGTAGSSPTATRTARGSSRSSTPGSRAATTRSTGTRPSSGCRPRASPPTPAATPSTPIRRTGRPRRSTTATSGWSSTSAASAGTTRSSTTPRRSGSSTPASTPSCSAPAPISPSSPRRSARTEIAAENRALRRHGASRRWRGSGVRRARPVPLPRPDHRRAHRQRLGRRPAAGLRGDPARRAPRRSPRRSTRSARGRASSCRATIPADPRFDAQRYWRGPVWLVVNYMIADGLAARRRGGDRRAHHRRRASS